LTLEKPARRFVVGPGAVRTCGTILVCALVLVGAACGGGGPANDPSQASEESAEKSAEKGAASQGAAAKGAKEEAGVAANEAGTAEERPAKEKAPGEGTLEPAEARVGSKEITNMLPADGKRPDPARPAPENPPEGVKTFPATTNRVVNGPVDYRREPPTNGDHAPLWQNCGFYEKPVKEEHAVHSMDHGVVWITYRPNLPTEGIRALRPYGEEDYVVVSPYPGQDAPVVATSWRVQLELGGPDDPRLREFVDGFRVSEIAPLSGNRCVGGVGNPGGQGG
jgi:hypothetical protein